MRLTPWFARVGSSTARIMAQKRGDVKCFVCGLGKATQGYILLLKDYVTEFDV